MPESSVFVPACAKEKPGFYKAKTSDNTATAARSPTSWSLRARLINSKGRWHDVAQMAALVGLVAVEPPLVYPGPVFVEMALSRQMLSKCGKGPALTYCPGS